VITNILNAEIKNCQDNIPDWDSIGVSFPPCIYHKHIIEQLRQIATFNQKVQESVK